MSNKVVVVTVTKEYVWVIDQDESPESIEDPWMLCQGEEETADYDVRLADRHDVIQFAETIEELREQGILRDRD